MKPLDIEIRRPIAPSVAMFVCAEVALFALIGLAKLPMPGLWWAVASVLPSLLLMRRLRARGYARLGGLVGIAIAGFCGGALGAHGRQLFCLLFV
jgi:hypothetical protein